MQAHDDLVDAQFLDRRGQDDLLAIDREARRGRGLGGVAGADRAVERAAVGGGADHDELLALQALGHRRGLAPGLEVLRLELLLLALEAGLVLLRGPERLALRQEVVARIAVLDVHDLAHLAELGDALQQDHLHGCLLTSRRRAGGRGSARA